MKIEVIETETLQKKHPQVMGVISVKELIARTIVPVRKGSTGYQYPAAVGELSKLILDLAAGRTDLPRPLLLNSRDGKESDLKTKGSTTIWTLPNKLWLIDGQTRLAALAHLLDEDPKKWSNIKIAISCLIGLSELEEMEMFYLNNASRPQGTDLARESLRKAGTPLPGDSPWQVRSESIIEKVSSTSPWDGHVRHPGAPRGQTTITSSSLARSLGPVLKSPFFSALGVDDQSLIISAYWQGVAQVLPKACNSDYALLKTTGAMALNTVIVDVIERLRSRNADPRNADQFANEISAALLDLSGTNQQGDKVSGVDFWQSGKLGAAGAYSSDSGRRLLAAAIRDSLAQMTI
jgi:hypothetical protein